MKKGFRGNFVEIPQHEEGYLVYILSTRKIILSSYDVFFNESFSSALAYTSNVYKEEMVMNPVVTYTPCATSWR